MNSYYHSVIHAKKHGGTPEDYQAIDDFIDSSKSAMADMRHRAILHSAFGIYLCEKVFGTTITNSEGIKVPVRLIAEAHIQHDLGFIPTVEHWLGEMPLRTWMGGTVKKTGRAPFKDAQQQMDAATRYKKNLRELGKSVGTKQQSSNSIMPLETDRAIEGIRSKEEGTDSSN